MKSHEIDDPLFRELPVVVRVDGRGFSKFTEGFEKPYDYRITNAMRNAAEEVLKQTPALFGFTHSDEASFVFYEPNPEQTPWFRNRPQKIGSIVSSIFSVSFSMKLETPAVFDGRTFQLPSVTELFNYFLWRENDAIRNHINAFAHEFFDQTELWQKDSRERKKMLKAKCIDVDQHELSHGTFLYRNEHTPSRVRDLLGSRDLRQDFETEFQIPVWP